MDAIQRPPVSEDNYRYRVGAIASERRACARVAVVPLAGLRSCEYGTGALSGDMGIVLRAKRSLPASAAAHCHCHCHRSRVARVCA